MTQVLPVDDAGSRDPLCPAPRRGMFCYDRWHVLQLIKDTARALGVGEREIAVLSAHLSVLPKGQVSSDGLLVSYAQVTGILERANCMDERRFRRGETRLEEVGLVARKLSGNARRYPVRDGRGQIVDAYGIDLRPLFLRVPELESLRQSLREDAARRQALRSRISARLSAIKRQAQTMSDDALDRVSALQKLCRRTSATLSELTAVERQIDDLEASVSVPADKQTVDGGQIVRCKESPKKEIKEYTDQPISLRVWHRCHSIQGYYPDTPRDLRAIGLTLGDLLSFLGFDRTATIEALKQIRTYDLLQMVDYVLGKVAQLKNPAAYLRSVLQKYRSGEAVADGKVCYRVDYDRGHNYA